MKDCPLYKEPCHEHSCEWYTHVIGKHPQTGEPIDHWGCAVAWLPILQIEGNQRMNQLGAATESLRNEVVRGSEALVAIGLKGLDVSLPAPVPEQLNLLDITPEEE